LSKIDAIKEKAMSDKIVAYSAEGDPFTTDEVRQYVLSGKKE
jgi:hypothetical protein